MHPLAQAASALLPQTVTRATPLQGGDLSAVIRLHLDDGTTAIAKSGPSPPTEAAMLGAIQAAGAPAPKVIGVDDTVLILEDLAGGGGFNDPAWADLGRHMRRLHSATGPQFGWDKDYAFGPVPIINRWHDSWTDFWAENRLLPALPDLPADLRPDLMRIANRLPDWFPNHPAPSLLHGDLWAGNILANGALSGLIDPACYYGHSEVDLAMLCLFTGPSPAFWAAYPLPQGNWPLRRALYQLWPALVHLRLFGSGYRPMIEGLLAQIPK